MSFLTAALHPVTSPAGQAPGTAADKGAGRQEPLPGSTAEEVAAITAACMLSMA
jgi:hypothetical protein